MNVLRLAGFALAALLFLLPLPGRTAAFLFDATKAETAGNADWVVDEDNNTVPRYPTPAASGITASTPETYWTGALSSWGVALVQLGHTVEQLPVGGRITYLDSTNAQDLSRYQVYVVCEPNILFTAAEKSALARYVQAGGSLFVVSDHANSDRNNDGYDSVQIWNDFFSRNGVQANPFGVTINSTDISLVSSYVDTAADDPLTNGSRGAVTLLKFSDGATMTLSPAANATVRAAFWSSGTHTNGNVMAAWGSFGAGRFAVVCDSSPPDDGTGGSGHTLYNGWTEEGVNHSRLFLNASVWLAAAAGGVPSNDAFANAIQLTPGAGAAVGTNVGATKQTGEPNHAGVAGGASVWWQFTAANGGTATLSTVGSDFDTLLAVYTGTAVNALTSVASNDNVDGSHTYGTVSFSVTAGTTYRVAVDGKGGATGHVALALALPGPANDAFANAAAITYSGAAVTLTGNNFNATAEPGEPGHAGVAGGRSVWWRWTAPASGSVTVSTAGSDFDTLLAVYTGAAVNGLTAVASNDNNGASPQSLTSFNAVAGVTYRVAVDGKAGALGNVSLTLGPGAVSSNPPANDAFGSAVALSGANVTTLALPTTYATKQSGEPNHGGDAGGHSLWWSWTAPSDGTVTVTTVGSDFDTTLGFYRGDAVGSLFVLGSDDDGAGNSLSKVVVNVAAGFTYQLAVDGFGGVTGNAVLNLSFAVTAPANDRFANAAFLSGTSVASTDNNANAVTTSATRESGEPNHAGHAGGHSVWWRWTTPSNGSVALTTIDSNFDTVLAVYTGSAVDALSPLVADDDDQNLKTSALAFNVTAGSTYYIAVDGRNGATGYAALRLTYSNGTLPPPANDSFANPHLLTGVSSVFNGTNANATLEPDETALFGGTHSVWCRWTAPAAVQQVTVYAFGQGNLDAALGVYTGASLGTLTLVAGNDDYDSSTTDSRVVFTSQPGVTYSFRVDSADGQTGSLSLNLASQLPPPMVGIRATTSQAGERGQVPGVFTVTLSGAAASGLNIPVAVNGTATAGADYSASVNIFGGHSATLFVPAGQTSLTVQVTPLTDNDPTEGDETVNFTLAAGDGDYSLDPNAASAVVTIRDDSPYTSAWAGAYRPLGFSGAGAAPAADPDNDGLSNLLEFAFNLNPLAADAPGALPVVGSGVFSDPADSTGATHRYATLAFTRRTDAPNLTYTVETATDPAAATWNANGAVFVSAATAGMAANTERAIYRAALPLDGPGVAPRQFLRVRVSAASP